MKGKFIGKSSLGFESGKTYNIRSDIKMVRNGGYIFGENLICICIYDKDSGAWCPYQSLESLLSNWEISI